MRRTKIICTLGPAVDSDEAVRALLEAGMNVARLNFSHGTHEEHARRIERVKRLREETRTPCAIMLDTKGPEIRTGLLKDGRPIPLCAGQTIVLTSDATADGSNGRIPQDCANLAQSLAPGARLLIDDGLIELEVTRILPHQETCDGQSDGSNERNGSRNGRAGNANGLGNARTGRIDNANAQSDLRAVRFDIECIALNDGALGERKSINAPGAKLPLPAVTEQDRADLLFGIDQGVDIVAASFIRDGDGVREIKQFLAEHGGADIAVVAKIEAAGALGNIHDIVREADGIMVARGDLGVEVPAYRVPRLQKEIIRLCNRESKPVITATQMLDSMISRPRPTRAEVADVANAIYDGTDCVMLSGETAQGAHPIEAVRTMASIAYETEPHLFDNHEPDRCRTRVRASLAVGIAAVQTAETLEAACIIAPTVTGRTARLISNLRPRMPIYAVTPNERVMRQMLLSWGVVPLLDEVQGERRQVMANALTKVRDAGYVQPGDLAVVTTGDPNTAPEEDVRPGVPGIAPTNVMQVVQVR